jgi:hypothetical protein
VVVDLDRPGPHGQVLPRLEGNGVHPGDRGPRFPQALG